MAHMGVMMAPAPYRIVRTKLSGAYFMVTLRGMGRVYLDGKWTDCPPGHAVLLMPGALNAFYAGEGQPWSHCWVRMAAGANVLHGPADRMQMVTKWDGTALSHALLGMRAEAMHGAAPPSLQRWAELVLHSVTHFRQQFTPDPRVLRLWVAVEKNLSMDWTLKDMTQVAALGPEHLRRLSKLATGRAPHAHLVYLRMKRASELLLSTTWTVERIAEAVGYGNAFVFSTTFKRVIGWPPSTYAKRAGK
jgi:AraC-like DNA-binding protein